MKAHLLRLKRATAHALPIGRVPWASIEWHHRHLSYLALSISVVSLIGISVSASLSCWLSLMWTLNGVRNLASWHMSLTRRPISRLALVMLLLEPMELLSMVDLLQWCDHSLRWRRWDAFVSSQKVSIRWWRQTIRVGQSFVLLGKRWRRQWPVCFRQRIGRWLWWCSVMMVSRWEVHACLVLVFVQRCWRLWAAVTWLMSVVVASVAFVFHGDVVLMHYGTSYECCRRCLMERRVKSWKVIERLIIVVLGDESVALFLLIWGWCSFKRFVKRGQLVLRVGSSVELIVIWCWDTPEWLIWLERWQ